MQVIINSNPKVYIVHSCTYSTLDKSSIEIFKVRDFWSDYISGVKAPKDYKFWSVQAGHFPVNSSSLNVKCFKVCRRFCWR